MTHGHDFSGHHFLVADDKPFIRTLINSMLLQFKANSVQFASSGLDTLNTLSTSDQVIDCLLCDWNMAPINGLQVLSLIRRGAVKGAARDLRVIMLTGHADAALVNTALSLDVNGYVVKPVAAEKLATAIDEAFSKAVVVRHVSEYAEIAVAAVPSERTDGVEHSAPWTLWQLDPNRNKASDDALTRIRQEASHQARAATRRTGFAHFQNERPCLLARIRPGVWLTRDIVTQGGTILLAAGVQLTAKLLVRLKSADPSDIPDELWVGDG